MKRIIRILLTALTFAAFLGISFGKHAAAAEGHSTSFSLLLSDAGSKLKKGQDLSFDIRMFDNSQKLLTFEFTVTYDAAHFDFVDKESAVSGLSVELAKQSQESAGLIRLMGWTASAIESDSTTLLTLKLKSKVDEADTNILLSVSSIGVEEGVGVFGVYNLGLNAVSFSKTVIPWWIWLVLAIGTVLTLAGGYLMMLFWGKIINKFIQSTARKVAEGSRKLAAKVGSAFARRPQAPKLKGSSANASAVQTAGSKPNPKPNVSVKELKNVTTVKTRMVNPDGSVTTITKKIVDDAEQNKKEK
jgi:hypothetical protein